MSVVKVLALGAVAGAVASAVKAASEPRLQQVTEQLFPPTPAEKSLVGADPGDDTNMPPAVVVEKVADAVVGSVPTDDTVTKLSNGIHYGMGTVFGALYALAVASEPRVASGRGVPAGYALYGMTHASTLPMLGIQPAPTTMPTSEVLWESASHGVYGLVLEAIRRPFARFTI